MQVNTGEGQDSGCTFLLLSFLKMFTKTVRIFQIIAVYTYKVG